MAEREPRLPWMAEYLHPQARRRWYEPAFYDLWKGARPPVAKRFIAWWLLLECLVRWAFSEERRQLGRRARLATVADDVTLAARMLLRDPAITLACLAILSIGVAAAGSVGAILHAVLLEPLPYPEPGRLAMVWPLQPDGESIGEDFSQAEFLDLAERNRSFSALAAVDYREFNLSADTGSDRLPGALVTSRLFEILQVAPHRGRYLLPEDASEGANPAVVLSYELWAGRFAGRSDIVGATIKLDDRAYRVSGVMPRGFRLPPDYRTLKRSRLWVALEEKKVQRHQRASKDLDAILGRLRPGISFSQAQEEMSRIHGQLVGQYPDGYREGPVGLVLSKPLEDATRGHKRKLFLACGAVVVILLVTFVNVASLTLARWNRRQREISLRSALGAGRLRLAWQLSCEGLVLGSLVAAASLAFCNWLAQGVALLFAAGVPRALQTSLTPWLAALVAGLGLVSGLGSGAIAAILARSRRPLMKQLRSKSAPAFQSGGPGALVAVQVALAVVLTWAAAILGVSFWNLNRVDLGFTTDRSVVTMELFFPRYRYSGQAQVHSALTRLHRLLGAKAGIKAVGAVLRRPLADRLGTWALVVEGKEGTARRPSSYPGWQVVTPGYFQAMGIGLREGRLLSDRDFRGRPGPVLVSESMARRYWPGESAVGRRLRLDGGSDNPWVTVEGVVADVRHSDAASEPEAVLYMPLPHWPGIVGFGTIRSIHLVVRSDLEQAAAVSLARGEIRDLDPLLPIASVSSTEEIAADSLAEARRLSLLVGVLSGLAVFLAAAGIYSAVSLLVSSRRPEIGIRMALGAAARDIHCRFLLQTGLSAGSGCLAGIGLAVLLHGFLQAFLFEVQPMEPLLLCLAAGLILAAAAAATLMPVRQALRSDLLRAIQEPP